MTYSKVPQSMEEHTASSHAITIQTPAIKIIAEVLTAIAVVWILVSIAGGDWVVVQFQYQADLVWQWGLWHTCNTIAPETVVCVETEWLTVCLIFCMVALLLTLTATCCGVLGLKLGTDDRNNIFYTIAGSIMSFVALLELIVVIIFPVKFGANIQMVETVQRWDFDWTYGFAWGGLIFSLGAAIFFFLPVKEHEPVETKYYTKEYS